MKKELKFRMGRKAFMSIVSSKFPILLSDGDNVKKNSVILKLKTYLDDYYETSVPCKYIKLKLKNVKSQLMSNYDQKGKKVQMAMEENDPIRDGIEIQISVGLKNSATATETSASISGLNASICIDDGAEPIEEEKGEEEKTATTAALKLKNGRKRLFEI